jgi:hypothetical protein
MADIFDHDFWMDTYYDAHTGKFRFKASDDEIEKFGFISPARPVIK